jgi:hypothetical protein
MRWMRHDGSCEIKAKEHTVAVASSRCAAAVGASASRVSAAALHFDVYWERLKVWVDN